uniref:Delta-1-pyrroline-5-carboxylate dehydrogenase, mitochondrial n=1 Tax=Megaselia scalaris TaxID=36166 RepID=T1GTU8_MEGSC
MACEQRFQRMPQNHIKCVASYYYASEAQVRLAIKTATEAQVKWDSVPIQDKINIWRKAADLMADKYRFQLLAATMLGQGKSIHQAEIDAACELIDFTRFNAYFLKELYKMQPNNPDTKTFRNASRIRGFEGFVAAISPFNFTAIAGNLAYTPALLGNSVVWKPSDNAILSNYIIFKIMTEAGVPDGVVNFVPCSPNTFGPLIATSPHLCGINFTGSVDTFEKIWRQIGRYVKNYKTYPRFVGELGGKNFHFVHPSADADVVIVHTILSAFEYSGQKCSACSRLYCPESLWPEVQNGLLDMVKTIKVGDVEDFRNFTSARRVVKGKYKMLCGGKGDCKTGYFIEPTIIRVEDPCDRLMKEEIFGPVLAVYVYEDSKMEEVIDLISNTTHYALTGAVFAEEETFLRT